MARSSFFQETSKSETKIFVTGLPEAKVVVTKEAEEMMAEFTIQVPHEVSWMGLVSKHPEKWELLIEQVFLLRQKSGNIHTVIEAASLAELVENNRDIAPEKLLFWGHTHPEFSVEGSGQDDSTMDMFKTGGHPWGLRGVFNKKGEANYSIFMFNVNDGIDVRVHHLPWCMEGAEQPVRACAASVTEQIKALVKTEHVNYATTSRTWGTRQGGIYSPGIEYEIDGVQYYQGASQIVMYKNKDGFWTPVPDQGVAQRRLKDFRKEAHKERRDEAKALVKRLQAGGAKIDDLVFDKDDVDAVGEPLDMRLLDNLDL